MRRTLLRLLAALAALALLATGCSDSDDGDGGGSDTPSESTADAGDGGPGDTAGTADDDGSDDDGGETSMAGHSIDCDALGSILEDAVGEAPEESFGSGEGSQSTTPLYTEMSATCSWEYPGTGARVAVSLKWNADGATDEDRGRWAGELVETFDPDSGGQVLAERDEEPESATVGDLGALVFARADGETAALYVLVDEELGLVVTSTDYAPAAATDVLVTLAEAALPAMG